MKCDTVAMHCKERNLNVDENQGIMWFCLLKICWTFVVHIPMLAINHKVEKQEYMQPTNTVHRGNILLLRQVWTSWKAQTRPISSPAVTGLHILIQCTICEDICMQHFAECLVVIFLVSCYLFLSIAPPHSTLRSAVVGWDRNWTIWMKNSATSRTSIRSRWD